MPRVFRRNGHNPAIKILLLPERHNVALDPSKGNKTGRTNLKSKRNRNNQLLILINMTLTNAK